MIKEAIETLKTLIVGSIRADMLEATSLRNATLYNVGGTLNRVDDEPEPIAIFAASLESFLRVVADRRLAYAEDTQHDGQPKASIWHADNYVVGLLNDDWGDFRDDRVRLELESSTKYVMLAERASTPRAHVDFVRFLVENFRDELETASPGLLGVIRSLRFTNNATAASDVQHGRESLGRDVENAISGAAALPETIVLTVPRWSTLDHQIAVECLLKLDPKAGTLALVPLADELAQGELLAQAYLHDLLATVEGVPVYHGTP